MLALLLQHTEEGSALKTPSVPPLVFCFKATHSASKFVLETNSFSILQDAAFLSECNCVNGTCNEGISGDGTCFCHHGWKGKNCNVCKLSLTVTRLQNSRFFFLKIRKEIGKAWRKSLTQAKRASLTRQSRSLFSASFQTFCLTSARIR